MDDRNPTIDEIRKEAERLRIMPEHEKSFLSRAVVVLLDLLDEVLAEWEDHRRME